MTQIANLLAVATVFIGLWTLISTFYCQRGGTKVPMQELELKMQRGAYLQGGGGRRNCGILRYLHKQNEHNYIQELSSIITAIHKYRDLIGLRTGSRISNIVSVSKVH